jgi:hypothetical protein
VEFGILQDRTLCLNRLHSIAGIRKSVKLYGFDKGWDWEDERGIPAFWGKLLGRSWASIACIVL